MKNDDKNIAKTITHMKRLETLPTRSEWLSRLKYFYLNQIECLKEQRIYHLRNEILDAYDFIYDTITMSVSIPCGGFRVYQKSLKFDSLANALALEFSISILINFILNIDFDFYSIQIIQIDFDDVSSLQESRDEYSLLLSLKTTLEVCA